MEVTDIPTAQHQNVPGLKEERHPAVRTKDVAMQAYSGTAATDQWKAIGNCLTRTMCHRMTFHGEVRLRAQTAART